MGFNLNKNEGSQEEPSAKKTGKYEFSLDKQEASSSPEPPDHSTSKQWLTGMTLIAAVAFGIWGYFYLRGSSQESQVVRIDSLHTSQLDEKSVETTEDSQVNSSSVHSENNLVRKANQVEKLTNKIPVTFHSGSSQLAELDQSLINLIVEYLKEYPQEIIHINGYASSEGPLELNQHLSQERAEAFRQHLISKDIAPNRVRAFGRGIENPIASNREDEGRQKNRRVEITFP